jgi:hypothetical protein
MLYKCCCKYGWTRIRKRFNGQGPCHTVLFKPKIITKIHTSNDSMSAPAGRVAVARGHDSKKEAELVIIVPSSTSETKSSKVVATDKH